MRPLLPRRHHRVDICPFAGPQPGRCPQDTAIVCRPPARAPAAVPPDDKPELADIELCLAVWPHGGERATVGEPLAGAEE